MRAIRSLAVLAPLRLGDVTTAPLALLLGIVLTFPLGLGIFALALIVSSLFRARGG